MEIIRGGSGSSSSISDDISILLPQNLYAVVNHELNIYFDNIIDCGGSLSWYSISVTCASGNQYSDRFSFTPSAAGTVPITIKVYKGHTRTQVCSTSSTINVVAELEGTPKTLKAMFIGDSLTEAGTYVDETVSLFSAIAGGSTLSTVGTLTTSGSNKHEGRGGWATNHYTTVASYNSKTNAFWDGSAFNFSNYMTTNSLARPDFVFIQLGTNDVWQVPNPANFVTNLTTMINSIKAYDSTIKIGISLTVPPAGTQDPFGKLNGTDSNMTRARHKAKVHDFVSALIGAFDGVISNVFVVPINTNLDTLRNFPTETVATSSRLAQSYTRISDQLHPGVEGRKQLADIYFAFIKNKQ